MKQGKGCKSVGFLYGCFAAVVLFGRNKKKSSALFTVAIPKLVRFFPVFLYGKPPGFLNVDQWLARIGVFRSAGVSQPTEWLTILERILRLGSDLRIVLSGCALNIVGERNYDGNFVEYGPGWCRGKDLNVIWWIETGQADDEHRQRQSSGRPGHKVCLRC